MILKLIRWLFDQLLGHLTAAERIRMQVRLDTLLAEVVRAGAEGATRGLRS